MMTSFLRRPGTVEALAAMFVKNNEVSSVAYFPIDQLLRDAVVDLGGATAEGTVKSKVLSAPLAPVWGTKIPKQKHLHFFSTADCLALEAMRVAGVDPNHELATTDGKMLVRPMRMTQRLAAGGGRHVDVFRWDQLEIRAPMTGRVTIAQ